MERHGKQGSETPEQADTLSATAMFLRGFQSADITPEASSSGEETQALRAGDADTQIGSAPERLGTGFPHESQPPTGPGEFTRLFKTPGGPVEPATEKPEPFASGAASQQAPGEFTRMFAGPAGSPPREASPQPPTAVPGPPAAKAKGFSTPGVSDSASGEGSFTQFFRGAGSAERTPSAPAPAPQPPRSFEEPRFPETPKQDQQVPGSSDLSITGILASLSTPGGGPGSSQPGGTGPYRASSPASSTPIPQKPQAEPQMDAGGITQLIQKLALEQSIAAPPPPPPVPTPAPPKTEPGEFTRMISKLSVESALAEAPPAPPANAAPPSPLAAAVPPIPVAAPIATPLPKAPAPPPFPAAVALPAVAPPQAPKPAPLPAPAVPKGKFEGMVPVLLVINTFLLLVLIVIVLFQARGH